MMIEITEEQVDKVREEANNSVSDHEAGGLYYALEILNIIDCVECRGTGKGDSEHAGALGIFTWVCESCNGRGWVHNG